MVAVGGLLSLTAAIGALAAHSDLPGQSDGSLSEDALPATSTPPPPAAILAEATRTATVREEEESTPVVTPTPPPIAEPSRQIDNLPAPEATPFETDDDHGDDTSCIKHETPAHGDTGGNHCGAQTGTHANPDPGNDNRVRE